MQHFRTTASARALLAAGQHLSRKDGGDALDLITRKFGEHTDEVIRRIGAFEEKQQDLAARMVEVEQKGARRRGPDTPATWGQQFVHAPGLKSFAEDRSRPGRFRVDVKAVTNAPDSGGSLGMAHRDTPALMPRQRLTVRDLLPTASISGRRPGRIGWMSRAGRVSPASSPLFGEWANPESARLGHHLGAARSFSRGAWRCRARARRDIPDLPSP
ncbi:hypothetical protein [Cereibacter johrii]|uniref:hypothetical protein n=1 Tax=Cereibacter johrii TaxID=445629 RepID=UPI003CF4DECB